jgi:hypothetical protein
MKYVRAGHFYIIPYAFTLLIISLGFFVFPSGKKLDTYFGKALNFDTFLNEYLRDDSQNSIGSDECAEKLAKTVAENLQLLIDKVNSDAIGNSTQNNYSRIRKYDKIFKRILYWLILVFQSITFFGSVIVFSWVVYFPIALLVFILKKIFTGYYSSVETSRKDQ